MSPGGQLGKSDRGDCGLVGKSRGNGGIVPFDDDGRVEQSDGHLEFLVDVSIEIGPEVGKVDTGSGSAESREFFPGDELTTGSFDRPEFGHRDTIARHDEGFPGGHRGDDLCIVVAQLSLSDDAAHERCSTKSYR